MPLPSFAYCSWQSSRLDHHRTGYNHTCSLWVAQPYRRTRLKVSFLILTGLPLTASRAFRHDPQWADRRHSIGKTRPSVTWSKPLNVDVEATTASLSFWHGNANIRRSNTTLGATDKHSCRITCMITHRSGLKLTVGRSAVSVYFNGTRVVGA